MSDERADAERADAERADAERADAERADAERADAERADAERADAEWDADAGVAGQLLAVLAAIREDAGRRRATTFLAAVAGLGFASAHWVGLVAGGALVALPARTIPRGVLAGLAFGVLALGAFVVATPAASTGELLALRPAVYVTVGSGLALPLLGSLVRGAV